MAERNFAPNSGEFRLNPSMTSCDENERPAMLWRTIWTILPSPNFRIIEVIWANLRVSDKTTPKSDIDSFF